MNIVTQALDYYDKNRESYSKFFSKVKFIEIKKTSKSDIDRNEIFFYDNKKNIIGKSKYELLGTYYSEPKTWVWSWAKAINHKNETYISRKILNYGLDINIDPKKPNISEKIFLKTELVTSRFRIHDPVQLDVHIALSSYISKIPIILPYVYTFIDESSSKDPIKKYYFNFDEIFRLKNYYINFFFILDNPTQNN